MVNMGFMSYIFRDRYTYITSKEESPCLIHIAPEECVERSHSPSLDISDVVFDIFSR